MTSGKTYSSGWYKFPLGISAALWNKLYPDRIGAVAKHCHATCGGSRLDEGEYGEEDHKTGGCSRH